MEAAFDNKVITALNFESDPNPPYTIKHAYTLKFCTRHYRLTTINPYRTILNPVIDDKNYNLLI